jgi:histidinol dehydrogenase
MTTLRRIAAAELPAARRDAVDPDTLAAASTIVDDVREGGEDALREHAERLGDIEPGAPIVLGPDTLARAREALPSSDIALLERTAERIRAFAQAQRASLVEARVAIEGGEAGHTISPVDRAGCYAPGGRFPLPSSVLMTVVTARAAGVGQVWVASPRPAPVTLAAAAVAGADGLIAVGGAQAIAALAYGAGPVQAVDVIVGPGNRWVTAAKQLVVGRVGIDMLAGPSELVVLADDTADPKVVAADLLAQAEHDVDARPMLVTTSMVLADRVNEALKTQLENLPTASTARAAVAEGFAVLCGSWEEALSVCDQIAPEHLEVMSKEPQADARRLHHYGALFLGAGAAEVMGDYGAGPNHVLPTGSSARFTGGLSVFDFLRVRTWMRIDDVEGAQSLVSDAVKLARHEGLEAHARSAMWRRNC